MTNKTFLIPCFWVFFLSIGLSLFIHSGSAEAQKHSTTSYFASPLIATLQDELSDGAFGAEIGSEINYTAELSVPDGDSVGSIKGIELQFDPSDGLDLSNNFETTPLAYDDIYTLADSNLVEVSAADGVLADAFSKSGLSKETLAADQDFDATPAVTVKPITLVSPDGVLQLESDGAFTYTRNSASTNLIDQFTYMIQDDEGHTDRATLTLKFESQGIIYVDNQGAEPGNGSLATPFQNLTDAVSAANSDCDVIFLFASPTPYDVTNIVLGDCQKIIGQDYGPRSFSEIVPDIDESVPEATDENRPMIRCSQEIDYLDGVDPSKSFPTTNQGCIELGANNIVAGINIINPNATQKAIAGENFDEFWGFNIGVNGSDGFSMSCNDSQMHTIVLSDDVKIDGYGYFGVDLASFGTAGCGLAGYLTDLTITNSASGAQEAVQAYAQSDKLLKLHLYGLTASNIENTVVRMTATHNGEAELNVQDANLTDFDSAGIYIENYVYWNQSATAGVVTANVSDSVLKPNTNGRAIMVNHLGRVLSNLSVSNNTFGEAGKDSDGIVIYANNNGPVKSKITDNQFLSRGAPSPNLPSGFTHAPQFPIYIESNIVDAQGCLDASGNHAVAGYLHGTGSPQASLGMKIGASSEMAIANWDGSGGVNGAENALEASNPSLLAGADLMTQPDSVLVGADCNPVVVSQFNPENLFNHGDAAQILADDAVLIPVLPTGKQVKIFTSAIVNEAAEGLDRVSLQGIVSIVGETENVLTVDPDPEDGFADVDGRTVTPLVEGLPRFSPSGDVEINEEDGEAVITLLLDAPASEAIAIDFTTVSGSAISGEDFLQTSGEIEFSAGMTTTTVSVSIVDDQITEAAEQFFVDFSTPGDMPVVIDDDRAQVTILPSDEIVVTPELIVEDIVVAENMAQGVVSLGLSEAIDTDVVIIYLLESGTAQAGVDFVEMAGEVLIAAGETSAEILVEILDDSLVEETESFTIRYEKKNGSNVSIPDPVSVVTISDNDQGSRPDLAAEDVIVSEDDDTATVTMSLKEIAPVDVAINFETFNGSASAGDDYVAQTGTIMIPAGELLGSFELDIIDDEIDEFNEYFLVRLTTTATDTVFIKNPELAVTIVDNDEILIYAGKFDGGSVRVLEGDGEAEIEVVLSRPSTAEITVDVSTAGLLATPADDYVELPTTEVAFAPGETRQTVNVTILDDDVTNELPEAFMLELSNPQNALLGRPSTNVIIIDNDSVLPFAFFEFADYSIYEDMDNNPETPSELEVQVQLSNASANDINIVVSSSDGTATTPEDYVRLENQSVIIPAGETLATFTVQVLEDMLPERPETFTLFIQAAGGAQIDPTQNSAEITIADGTPPLIQVQKGLFDGPLAEAKTAQFLVLIEGNVVLPLRFAVNMVDEANAEAGRTRVYHMEPGTHLVDLNLPVGSLLNRFSVDQNEEVYFADLVELNGVKKGFEAVPVISKPVLNRHLFLPYISR